MRDCRSGAHFLVIGCCGKTPEMEIRIYAYNLHNFVKRPVVVNERRSIDGSQVLSILHRNFICTHIPLTGLFVVPEGLKVSNINKNGNIELDESLPRVHWSQDNVLIGRVYGDAVTKS